MKIVRVILIDDARESFESLNKIVHQQTIADKKNTAEMQILRSIKQKVDFLKKNPFYGDNIPKSILKQSNYDTQNLWRIELTNFWRMLYTIKGDQVEIICFILDILNHVDYNKKLGYKKR